MTNTILITSSKKKNSEGLIDLYLDAFQNENYLGRLIVNSGTPGKQNFRTVPDEKQGILEPCPEGEYDLGSLDWAGKDGDYHTLFREIKSPIWVTIYRKRAIGFHLDGNRSTAPGSAGCIVFKHLDDLKAFVNCWKGYGGFTKCYTDWSLGYVKVPVKLKELIKNPKPMKSAQ
jgi:hypothetical protein